MIKKSGLALVLTFFISGCEWKATSVDETTVVARVGESVLTQDELVQRDIYREGMSDVDSAQARESFVSRWIKDQLLVKRAEFNLNEQQRDFDRKVEDYRKDLMIFAYQQAYLKENLDTSFTQEEIQAFYNENKDMFLLRENIYKLDYVSFPNDAPGLSDFEKAFFKGDDPEAFAETSFPYANHFSMGDTTWLSFADIVNTMPILMDHESDFISRKKKMKYTDDEYVYWLVLTNVKLKENNAPVDYVESAIRSILLNQRKRTVLKNLEEKLYSDGIKKNQVEIFN
jgi:hypothetical protein